MSPSSGPTCEDRKKAAAATLLLGLLLAATALLPGMPAPASAQPNPAPLNGVPLYLGFGPSTLLPVSGGAPVYTVGETIWAESGYNYTVSLSLATAESPSGVASSSVVAQLNLLPQTVSPVYTFKASDPDGVWDLTVETQLGPVLVPLRFVNLNQRIPVLQGPLQYSLEGGNLSVSAPAELGGSYDQQVCAEGSPSQPSASVAFTLPRGMEELGSLTLTPGSSVGVSVLGVLNESLSFWFELYQSYALDLGGSTNLVAYDLMAAQSHPIDIIGSGPLTANLTWNAPLRAGRYDLRAFFENATSLDVSQTNVLVLNDSFWVPLSAACPPEEGGSSGISYTAGLASGPGSWPRTLYYMYRTSGVEAVAAYHLKANLSSIEFVASPWAEPVEDSQVSVTSSTGVAQTSQNGGTLFVLASSYPASLTYSLAIGGAGGVAEGSSTVDEGYTSQSVQVSLGELKVQVSGSQASASSLQVSGPRGLGVTRSLPAGDRSAILYLPTGSYTVSIAQGGQSQSSQVQLTDGVAASVSLNPGAPLTLEVILVVTAVVAALANILVWALRWRAPRVRLPREGK